MPTASGIVLIIEGNRRVVLLDAIRHDDIVAEAVPDFDHSRNAPLIAFLGFQPGAITHISGARRGVRAATGLRRLNLSEVFKLPQPVDSHKILDAVPVRVRRHAATRFANGGLLPPATFRAVVEALRGLSEASRPLLDRFSEARRRTSETT